MDDEHAHFLVMFESVCWDARLANLVVEVGLLDGSRIRGIPRLAGSVAADELDRCTVGEEPFRLEDVVAFCVVTPGAPMADGGC